MQDQAAEKELRDRLDLIESMISEGRRKTESWGWTFLLWGIAYFVAIFWTSSGGTMLIWGRSSLAWPVTMFSAAGLTMAIGIWRGRGKPDTAMGRAIVSIWIAVGISMLLIFPSLAMNRRLDEHSFVAIVAGMLAIANGASGMILKWRSQIACAVLWWITTVAACFGSEAQLTAVFLSALFLCQIVFGIYAMMMESRRRQREIAHA
jgi:peptidoglycan/LPS O-acetylase OafA/YrhL